MACEIHRLVDAAKSGSALAVREICTTYLPRLRSYYRHKGLDAERVQDATQETLLRMLRALLERRIASSTFEAWLFATARNVYVNEIRSDRKWRTLDPLALGAAEDQEHARSMDGSEILEVILDAVLELPDSLQVPFCQRYLAHRTYSAIAESLGITVNAVGLRLFRARRKLREILTRRLGDFLT